MLARKCASSHLQKNCSRLLPGSAASSSAAGFLAGGRGSAAIPLNPLPPLD